MALQALTHILSWLVTMTVKADENFHQLVDHLNPGQQMSHADISGKREPKWSVFDRHTRMHANPLWPRARFDCTSTTGFPLEFQCQLGNEWTRRTTMDVPWLSARLLLLRFKSLTLLVLELNNICVKGGVFWIDIFKQTNTLNEAPMVSKKSVIGKPQKLDL